MRLGIFFLFRGMFGIQFRCLHILLTFHRIRTTSKCKNFQLLLTKSQQMPSKASFTYQESLKIKHKNLKNQFHITTYPPKMKKKSNETLKNQSCWKVFHIIAQNSLRNYRRKCFKYFPNIFKYKISFIPQFLTYTKYKKIFLFSSLKLYISQQHSEKRKH